VPVIKVWQGEEYQEFAVADVDSITPDTKTVYDAPGRVVVKELYFTSVPKDDATGQFNDGQYAILYNNSDVSVSLKDICFATALPSNGHATVNSAYENHESEGWISAGWGIFAIERNIILDPGKQIVIGLTKTIDHTAVANQSKGVNLDKPEYYAQYDPASGFDNATGHPAPSNIPASHFLKGYKTATSPSWVLSVSSPAFFIFKPQGSTPAEFAVAENTVGTSANTALKVPEGWVIDGVEIYDTENLEKSTHKRINNTVDAGYVEFITKEGYSVYRNVDKEATEAIAENAGKLVYNYSGGAGDSTDESGIDAEASIKKGARIIYLETNNSTADFHLRKQATLKN